MIDLDKSGDHVLVRFALQVHDDWPPTAAEDIWALPLQGDQLRLANVPLFAVDVAFDDVISATRDGDVRLFESVVESSGHSTIRVIAATVSDVEDLAADVADFGCAVAMCFIPAMFAVDVPPELDYSGLHGWLSEREAEGVLDFEEAYLAAAHAAQAGVVAAH